MSDPAGPAGGDAGGGARVSADWAPAAQYARGVSARTLAVRPRRTPTGAYFWARCPGSAWRRVAAARQSSLRRRDRAAARAAAICRGVGTRRAAGGGYCAALRGRVYVVVRWSGAGMRRRWVSAPARAQRVFAATTSTTMRSVYLCWADDAGRCAAASLSLAPSPPVVAARRTNRLGLLMDLPTGPTSR